MERTHTPLSCWLWAGVVWLAARRLCMSAVQFQRQLGLSRYETSFQILHKLRAGMGRTGQDGIGGKPEVVVEADETSIITEDWSSYAALGKRGYLHTAALREGNCCVAETFCPSFTSCSPISRLGFAASITASARSTSPPAPLPAVARTRM